VARRFARAGGIVAVTVAGAAVGAALAPTTTAYVGPLRAEVAVVPSLHPGVQLMLPPAGEVDFATHRAPLAVQARIREVDLEGARRLLDSPGALLALERSGPEALRQATVRAAVTTALCALLGAGVLSLLVYRRSWVRTGEVAATLVGTLVTVGGMTVATFEPDRLAQPQFTGLLSQAPYVAGTAGSLMGRLESYRSGLADIVQGVTALYATSGTLPVLPGKGKDDLVTVLHVSDIHLNPLAFDVIDKVVAQFGVDVVVDTGDITTWGTEVESRTLPRIRGVKVPYVFVRGNHDSALTEAAVAANPNAVVLDGRVAQVGGLVIAGIGDPTFTPDNPQDAVSTPTRSRTASAPEPDGRAVQTPPPASAPPDTSDAGPTGRVAAGATSSPPITTDRDVIETAQSRAYDRLSVVIRDWNVRHPGAPVQIAAVHEPSGLNALLGEVPLVLAGHTHRREVRLDPSGTRIMIEGSTGGAGITARGLERLSQGTPLPLAATLVYLARSGDRAGRVVAYDEVTVGGFGLASVTLERHVVRDDPSTAPADRAGAGGQGTPTGGGGSPRVPGGAVLTPSDRPSTPAG
jgi:predicted phosphodiesterase